MANCCTECFLDYYLKKHIREEGAKGNCDFCGSKRVYIINPKELKEWFDPLVNLYTAQVEFLPMELLKENEGRFIWEILTEDWSVFDDWEVGENIIQEMYGGYRDDPPLFLDNYVEREDDFYGQEDLSDKLKNQWDEFSKEIKHGNRFFPEKKMDTNLIGEILSFSSRKISGLRLLHRARLSTNGKKLLPKSMGRPPKTKAIEGRANPVGIPYLYLASDINTAISEKRPQLTDKITVGKYKVKKKLNVIDLRNPQIGSPFKWGDKLDFVLEVQGFLQMLGFILSKPVKKDREPLEYLPTQYLCELIKNEGFEGVMYKSNYSEGYNIVLFDDSKVECTDTRLYMVKSVKIETKKLS